MSDSEKGDNDFDEEEEVPNYEESQSNADEEIGQFKKKQNQQKLIIEQNVKDKTCGTYVFLEEDHTLGNALRYMLIKRKDVEFCGYSIPHPSESKMNLRLQTLGKDSNEVMQLGLENLAYHCDLISNKFEEAVEKFKQEQQQQKQKKKVNKN